MASFEPDSYFKLNNLESAFYTRISQLRTPQRTKFVHGVYKQIAESHRGRTTNGEYRHAFRELNASDQSRFVKSLCNQLIINDLESHALRLLKEGDCDEYELLKESINQLDRADPKWREKADIRLLNGGIQIRYGDWSRSNFSSSIINRPSGFEILSCFEGGPGLSRAGLDPDEYGYYSLENAISVANAVLSKDPLKVKNAVEKAGSLAA